MSYPVEHKTVFVLDRGPLFARSCKQSIEYDVMSKTKTPGIIPAAPITKSMWTCNVETMIEYMRIVFDIFPAKRTVGVKSKTEKKLGSQVHRNVKRNYKSNNY